MPNLEEIQKIAEREAKVDSLTRKGHSEAEARAAVARHEKLFGEVLSKVSPEWRSRLERFIQQPKIAYSGRADQAEAAGTQGIHGPQTLNPQYFESLTREENPFLIEDDPTREEIADHLDLSFWGGNPDYPAGEGTGQQTTRHETGHAIDDLMWPPGPGRHVHWSMSPEGKKFFESGTVIPGLDGVTPNNVELMASIIDKAMRTMIVPKSYGDDFYNRLHEVIPGLQQVDLNLADRGADTAGTPFSEYVRAAALDAETDQEESEQTRRALARYLFAGDPRDRDKSTVAWVPEGVVVNWPAGDKPAHVPHPLLEGLVKEETGKQFIPNATPSDAFEAAFREYEATERADPAAFPSNPMPPSRFIPHFQNPGDMDPAVGEGGLTEHDQELYPERLKRWDEYLYGSYGPQARQVGDSEQIAWEAQFTDPAASGPYGDMPYFGIEDPVGPAHPLNVGRGDIIDPGYFSKSDAAPEYFMGGPPPNQFLTGFGDREIMKQAMTDWKEPVQGIPATGGLDDGFYIRPPEGGWPDVDPGFSVQPPPGGRPDIDPGFSLNEEDLEKQWTPPVAYADEGQRWHEMTPEQQQELLKSAPQQGPEGIAQIIERVAGLPEEIRAALEDLKKKMDFWTRGPRVSAVGGLAFRDDAVLDTRSEQDAYENTITMYRPNEVR